ncbi:MAG: flavodoxin domain-containing protein [Chromatiaceae bacterium]|nr:flavodoxin domain-containing protein [Chromatiaceae bacterium]
MQTTQAQQAIAQLSPGLLSTMQLNRLHQAIQDLTAEQLSWASGYLAGIRHHQAPVVSTPSGMGATIVYASQTGNARSVAEALAAAGRSRGVDIRLLPVDQVKPRELSKARLLLLVVSTHGEGEPPEVALELYRFLHSTRAPRLNGLKYAVFGLGDSSYEHFCQAARDFDLRLEELGASRLLERVDADLDFLARSRHWVTAVLGKVDALNATDPGNVVALHRPHQSPHHDRCTPYRSELLESRRITTSSALTEVRHLVLQVDPGTISYTPGDSLGVWFRNDPMLVAEILRRTGLEGDARVSLENQDVTLQEALSSKLELTRLHPAVVARWAEVSGVEVPQPLIGDQRALREYCSGRQFVDLLAQFPAHLDADALVQLLLPLQPRLYSIASSQSEYPEEVHLCVSVVRYRAYGRDHLGGASGFLGERSEAGDPLDIYVTENPGFRLPEDGDTPIIMIGAGTGIAPYRAFLQQRAAQGDSGDNWLIFGNRHFHHDFLYQTEWLALRKAGLLKQTTLAFSRDGSGRCYVQDRMLDQAKALYRWLQEGARVYVCGSARMESGVRDALTRVAQSQGGMEEKLAGEYVEHLRTQGRYLREFY